MAASAYTKTIKLDDGSTDVVLGGREVKEDVKNKLNATPIAQETAGSKKTLALNLNQITRQFNITAVLDDAVASSLNSGSDTKETIRDDFVTIFEGQNEITLTIGSDTYTGFIQQYTITETAEDDSARYVFKIRFLESQKMN